MTSLNSYDDVIKYIEKRIPYYYGEYFRETDLATCSSQLIAILNQNFTVEGDLNCRLNMTANQSSSRDALCVDVSEKLRAMSLEDRNKMFDVVIKRLEQEEEFKNALVNRTNFRKDFLEKLKVELHNIPQSAQISCNSNIIVDQAQNIIFKGDLNCDEDSEVNLDSTLIATQQMRCLSGILIDRLKRDNLLRQSFNRGDNQDCVYDLVQVSPCRMVNGVLQREYKVIIIENKVGRGECKIKEENINLNKKTISNSEERGFFEPCTSNQCEVSNWNAWSPCYDVKDSMGQMKKMQYRVRQMLKQGTICPADKRILQQERECPTTTRFASIMGVESEVEAVEQKINKDDKKDKKNDGKASWWIIALVIFILVLLILMVLKKMK